MVGNQNLVRVAVVHEPRDAIPLQGTWIGTASDHFAMKVAVKVTAANARAGASAPVWNDDTACDDCCGPRPGRPRAEDWNFFAVMFFAVHPAEFRLRGAGGRFFR
jgi:hypothetical protein